MIGAQLDDVAILERDGAVDDHSLDGDRFTPGREQRRSVILDGELEAHDLRVATDQAAVARAQRPEAEPSGTQRECLACGQARLMTQPCHGGFTPRRRVHHSIVTLCGCAHQGTVRSSSLDSPE